MAIALVQEAEVAGSIWVTDGVEALNFPGATTVNNLVVVLIWVLAGRTVASVADEDAGAYGEAITITSALGGGTVRLSMHYLRPTTAVSTITATLNAATGSPGGMWIGEFSDVQATPLGTTNSNTVGTPGTSHDTGNVTTDVANAVLVGASLNVDSTTWTIDGDFSEVFNADAFAVIGYDLLAATGTHSMTNTSSGNVDSVNLIAWFKGNVAGGAVSPHAPATQFNRGRKAQKRRRAA